MQTLGMAMWSNWWGGYSYGPRFATDLVPLFSMLGILGYAARRLRLGSAAPSRWFAASLATVLVIGVMINGAGAIHQRGMGWNAGPPAIARDPSRVFDWRRAQFLCGLSETRCP